MALGGLLPCRVEQSLSVRIDSGSRDAAEAPQHDLTFRFSPSAAQLGITGLELMRGHPCKVHKVSSVMRPACTVCIAVLGQFVYIAVLGQSYWP